jgi:hypothetical protein
MGLLYGGCKLEWEAFDLKIIGLKARFSSAVTRYHRFLFSNAPYRPVD